MELARFFVIHFQSHLGCISLDSKEGHVKILRCHSHSHSAGLFNTLTYDIKVNQTSTMTMTFQKTYKISPLVSIDVLCSFFLVYGELSYLFFDFRRNSSTKMVNNSQMWMVILIAFLLLFCLDVKVSQMEKRNAQLNTQCDISVFTETEIDKQDESFQNIKWCE